MGKQGFSLMEVMIVVVIIGILAAIAIPSYSGYVTRTRRAEAVTALQTVALYQEKHMAERGQYGTIAQLIANVGLPDPDNDNQYEPSEFYGITVDLVGPDTVSYTHLRAHETVLDLVCRLLLEKKKKKQTEKRRIKKI